MRVYIIKYTYYLGGANKYALEYLKSKLAVEKTILCEDFPSFVSSLRDVKEKIKKSRFYDNLKIYIGEVNEV